MRLPRMIGPEASRIDAQRSDHPPCLADLIETRDFHLTSTPSDKGRGIPRISSWRVALALLRHDDKLRAQGPNHDGLPGEAGTVN